MMVKSTDGQEFNAASSGKGNLGVALGAVGAGLGILNAAGNNNCGCNDGLLGNPFGLNNNGCNRNRCNTEVVPVPMAVSEHQYYEDTIRRDREYYNDTVCNQREFFNYAMGVSDRICALEQRVAVDEASIAKNFDFMANENSWQNKFFDEKIRYADLLEQCRIQNATCKCIKGEVYASPSDLADPYSGRRQVIGSYSEPIGYNNGCGCGWNNWNTWNNWGGCNNGCGCGF